MNFPIILGAGFLIIGLLLLLKAVVPSFQFGIFRFVVGAVIILFGISVLFSSFESSSSSNTVNVSSGTKQTVSFGERTIDIDKDLVGNIELECSFGSLTVYIPKDKNISFASSCAFGTITLPSGNSIYFGTLNESSSNSGAVLNIKLNCAFGSIHVKYKN